MTKRKRRIIGVTALLGAYLVSYAVLSFFGGYWLVNSGRIRPLGLAIDDTFIWQPRFGMLYPFRTGGDENTFHFDAVGLLYFPLVRLDQTFFHPSRPYLTFENDDLDKPRFHPWPPTEQMHPVARRLIAAIDAARDRHSGELDAARKRKDRAEVSRIEKQAQDEVKREIGIQP